MALINKYRYLQAFFVGLPMGIISLFVGYNNIVGIKQDINDYAVINGVVDSIYIDFIKLTPRSEYSSKALSVKIREIDHHVFSKKKKNSIINNLKINDEVYLWYQEKETGNKIIKSIKKGDTYIIKYEPGGYWVGIVFIIWGLFWIIVSGLYIVKHREDLMGEKKAPEE